MTARTYAADDVPEINRNLARVRRNCFMKLFGSSTGCWCMGFYADGTSASCNTARELIGIEKPGVSGFNADRGHGGCSRFEALGDFPATRWVIRGPKPVCSCGHPENSALCDRWGCWAFRK